MSTAAQVAGVIEHSLLKADATEDQILTLAHEALKYSFYSVCVNPTYVRFSSDILQGTAVRVSTVVGFPLGASTTEVKVFEAREALLAGADEVDMVMQIGAARSGDWDKVKHDIQLVREEIPDAVLKVIIEACLLHDDEKLRAVEMAIRAGADFVKTSTGFSTGGATVSDIRLMKSVASGRAKIKAAGGIKTLAQLEDMVEAGADLIGTSSGVSICCDSGLT